MNAQAMLTGDAKRYDWKDRITPSMALGIQNKDTSLFSLRGAAGTVLDISGCPDYLPLAGFWRGGQDRVSGREGRKGSETE